MRANVTPRVQYHYSTLCGRDSRTNDTTGSIRRHDLLSGRYVDVPNCGIYDGSVRSEICNSAGGFHFCHGHGVDAVYWDIYGITACRSLHADGERHRFRDDDDTRRRLSTPRRNRRVLRVMAAHGRFRRFGGTRYRR